MRKLHPDLGTSLDFSNSSVKFVSWLKFKGFHIQLVVKRSEIPFSIIHTDVWGPLRVTYICGAKWFISLIDVFSRTTCIYLLKDKSETIATIQNFFPNDPNTI